MEYSLDLERARAQWRWRGKDRPAFAVAPQAGQESVWDYPRPPAFVPDTREVIVRWGNIEVARTSRAVRSLETAHPPSFYLPWTDVDLRLFKAAPGSSFCEWKGPACYWSLVDGNTQLPSIAWSYPRPFASAELIADCVALYVSTLACTVGGAHVTPQPGGFYGGWITPEVVGPFKGVAGSNAW